MSMVSSLRRATRAAVFGLVFSHTVLVRAEGAAPPLTLGDAVARAIATNPELRATEYTVQATKARESKAAHSPPLSVDTELEDFAGTGDLTGTDGLQTTLRLSGVIELGDKRSARVAFAAAETDSAVIGQRTRRLDLLSKVATRFTEGAVRQEHVAVMYQATQLASAAVESIAQRVGIGAAPPHERGKAEIRLARARIDEEHAEHEFASARVQLAATWGETRPDFDRVAADLFALPEVATLDQLLSAAEKSSSIQQMLSLERVAEARINAERAAQMFDIRWSGGVRRLDAIDDSAFVASIGVPLGNKRRAEGAIREAEAARTRASFDTAARRIEINAALFDLYQELGHAKLEARTLRETVQPEAEAVLQSVDQAFRQGRISFLELANAQQELLSVQRDAIASAGRYHTLLIEIERLTGSSLDSDDMQTGDPQ